MKKFLSCALAACLVLGLSACGGPAVAVKAYAPAAVSKHADVLPVKKLPNHQEVRARGKALPAVLDGHMARFSLLDAK